MRLSENERTVTGMAEYIEKWPVVNRLIDIENEFQQYKPFHGFEHAMYRKICEAEIAIGKTQAVDVAPVVRCRDCKHQCKIWHADKRMKEKGYWIYSCKRNSDPFVSHTVNGYDDEYCCYGERKKGENDE